MIESFKNVLLKLTFMHKRKVYTEFQNMDNISCIICKGFFVLANLDLALGNIIFINMSSEY